MATLSPLVPSVNENQPLLCLSLCLRLLHRRFEVAELGIEGRVAHASIDYDPEAKVPNMFRLMQIEGDISKALGIPVTITTRNALHPLMKESIERDAIRVS